MNHYQVLQVDRAASPEVIEAAYRRLAKMYHPDVNPNASAQEKMKAINAAYSVLRDPASRLAYDRRLEQEDSRTQGRTEQAMPGATSEQWGSNSADRVQAETPGTGNAVPFQCAGCGRSGSTLRFAIFPYVISFVLITFRREWHGVYCQKCRRKEMSKAKLITALLGWWGIPFGILYAARYLFFASEGVVPAQQNAAYLRVLGLWLLEQQRVISAKEAMDYSLAYEWDADTVDFYRKVFGSAPESGRRVSHGELSGGLVGLAAISAVVAVFVGTGIYLGLLANPFSGTGSQLRDVAVVTPTPSTRPAAATVVTSALRSTAPANWKKYTNQEMEFTAYIPDDYKATPIDPVAGNPASRVVLEPDRALTLSDPLVGITYVPGNAGQMVSRSDFEASVRNWLDANELKVISPPIATEIAGREAMVLEYEGAWPDGQSYNSQAAFLNVPGKLIMIEVISYPDSAEGAEFYRTFTNNFVVLD